MAVEGFAQWAFADRTHNSLLRRCLSILTLVLS
jgi:hypothetical protein